ncbi:CHAT domain-containing protein [Ilyonectria destructans]|nr:CHAT domain-containing protein [Ilyonectria destructans]
MLLNASLPIKLNTDHPSSSNPHSSHSQRPARPLFHHANKMNLEIGQRFSSTGEDFPAQFDRGMVLIGQVDSGGNPDELEEGICAMEAAMDNIPQNPLLVSEMCRILGVLVAKQYGQVTNIIQSKDAIRRMSQNERVKKVVELDNSIRRMKKVSDTGALAQTLLTPCWSILSDMLFRRSQLKEDPRDDLGLAAFYAKQVFEFLTEVDATLDPVKMNCSRILHRHQKLVLQNTRDEHDYPTHIQPAASTISTDTFQEVQDASHVGDPLINRYLSSWLTRRIRLHAGPLDSISKATESTSALLELGQYRRRQYEATGCQDDLNEALKAFKNARDDASSNKTGSHERGKIFKELSQLHLERHRRDPEGNIQFLDKSIRCIQIAMNLMDDDPSERADLLHKHAVVLIHRSERTGNADNLEVAQTKIEEAMSVAPPKRYKEGIYLKDLAAIHLARYRLSGHIHDLELAIQKCSESMAFLPPAEVGRVYNNLAGCYDMRHLRLGDKEDVKKAVAAMRDALRLTETTDLGRNVVVGGLAKRLLHQYRQSKDLKDLKEAETTMNEAISMVRKGHLDESNRLFDFAKIKDAQWQADGNIDHLNSAIDLLRLLKDRQHHSDHTRTMILGQLAVNLIERAAAKDELAAECEDVKEFKQMMTEAVSCSSAPAQLRAFLALRSIRLAYHPTLLDWKDELAGVGLELLPFACSRDLSRADQQHAIQLTSGLAADGCAISIQKKDFGQALQRVEYGRGLIMGHLIDREDDLAKLKSRDLALAQEYENLRQRAFQTVPTTRNESWEGILRERRAANSDLKAMEDRIRREIPDFEQFQKPPSITELQKCASEGPIVIVNITDIRSDALLVTQDTLDSIPLPTESAEVPKMLQGALERYRGRGDLFDIAGTTRTIGSDLSETDDLDGLSWLWHSCVRPVLNHLKLLSDPGNRDPPRMWWIGSGAASSLPFHAAGEFGTRLQYANEPKLPPTCLSYVTPSYASTIKALQHSRRRAEKLNFAKESPILFIAMPTTPGYSALSGVQQEKDAVNRAVEGAYHFKPLEFPTAEEVMEQIKYSQVVHFACHGSSDMVNPSDSHLILQKRSSSGKPEKDKLTVGSLLDAASESESWIVYLSACSTAQVKAEELIDESLHLASAFQVAGFAHAIGSLWTADDETCVKIARLFYQELTTFGSDKRNNVVPQALRRAVMKVQAQKPLLPSHWAPFIHYGA